MKLEDEAMQSNLEQIFTLSHLFHLITRLVFWLQHRWKLNSQSYLKSHLSMTTSIARQYKDTPQIVTYIQMFVCWTVNTYQLWSACSCQWRGPPDQTWNSACQMPCHTHRGHGIVSWLGPQTPPYTHPLWSPPTEAKNSNWFIVH